MQANIEPKKRHPLFFPGLAVVCIAAVIIISGVAGVTGPNGLHLIKSGEEYQDVLKEANAVLAMAIEKSDKGETFTPDDIEKMKEAERHYDELNLFVPSKMGPYFGSGRLLLFLGDSNDAALKFRQAIDNAAISTSDPQDKVALLKADSELYLATAYLNLNDFKDAKQPIDDAVKAFPKRPDYLIMQARVLIQEKDVAGATKALKKAVALDPKNEKAISLLKFVDPTGA